MSIMYVKLRVSSYLQLVLEDLPRYTRDMSRVAILIEQCQASEPHIIHYILRNRGRHNGTCMSSAIELKVSDLGLHDQASGWLVREMDLNKGIPGIHPGMFTYYPFHCAIFITTIYLSKY